jgi:photosystem II stability/assembly factor-like uncharacterized protein
MRKIPHLLFLAITLLACQQPRPALVYVSVGDDITFWAVSAVDELTAWVSGSKGSVGRTVDGGQTWTFGNVAGFEDRQFRSIYAMDDQRAIVASVGSPAFALRTDDGGKSWKQVYKNEAPEAFIDGLDFWNEREGLMYGDPINGRMLLLRTSDGGETWSLLPETSRPALEKGEASFASSGTGSVALPIRWLSL